MINRGYCLACARRSTEPTCAHCGAAAIEATWTRATGVPLRRLLPSCVILLFVGTLFFGAGHGNVVNMLTNERNASAGRWITVMIFVAFMYAGSFSCVSLVFIALFGRRWDVFAQDGAVSGVVHMLFGKIIGGGVMYFDAFRDAPATGVTSDDIRAAGPARVAALTEGRLTDANTMTLYSIWMGLVSCSGADVAAATMRGWSRPAVWRKTARVTPTPTMLFRSRGAALEGLPALERAFIEGLRSLETSLSPQRWFENTDVFYEMSKSPARAVNAAPLMNTEPPTPEALGRAVVTFYEAVKGRELRFTTLPTEYAQLLAIASDLH